MGIVSVSERTQGRNGPATFDGISDITRRFLVITDSATTSALSVRRATGIPTMGSQHPEEPRAIVVKIDPQPVGEGRTTWEVDVTYSTKRVYPDINFARKPWNRRPQIRWGNYAYTEAVLYDRDNTPITNSAGDLVVPALQVERHNPTLTIVRYERRYDINNALLYVDRVNYPSFLVCGLICRAEGALLTAFQGENVQVDGVECWQVTYQLVFSADHVKTVLDQGFNVYTAGKKGMAKDSYHKDVTEPVLLDGAGGRLSLGGTPQYRTWRVYPRADFQLLGLP